MTKKKTIKKMMAAISKRIPTIAAITRGLLVCQRRANLAPSPGWGMEAFIG